MCNHKALSYFKIISCILIFSISVCHATENKYDFKNTDITAYWPASPISGINSKKSLSSSQELIYKQSTKIWPELHYTDTEIRSKALRGLLWMIKFMSSNDNLQGNENNYLTMLGTMYSSAHDPYFRRIAWEEARMVINKLIATEFFNRSENDIDSLLEYLTLFNQFRITNHQIQKIIFQKLEKEKQNIINQVQKLKNGSVDGDQLYDTMLLTYYITNQKKCFPQNGGLQELPDLRDFFEILTKYKYHMENQRNPDYSKLTSDDIGEIADDLYNITHVIFVVCDYNSYKVPKRYFQREINYMLKYADLICSKYHHDPDLLAEVLNVLSMMGYSKNHDLIKAGWIKILDAQKEDGSWEAFGIENDETAYDKNYNIFHATWVSVDMITEPLILGTAPFYKPLKQSLENYGNTYNKTLRKVNKKR